jgi:hypothetical protein
MTITPEDRERVVELRDMALALVRARGTLSPIPDTVGLQPFRDCHDRELERLAEACNPDGFAPIEDPWGKGQHGVMFDAPSGLSICYRDIFQRLPPTS